MRKLFILLSGFIMLAFMGIFITSCFVLTNQFTPIKVDQTIGNLESLKKAMTHAVTVLNMGDDSGICSGAVLKNTDEGAYVLTAKHCILDSIKLYVDGIPVISIQSSVTQDLALLKTNQIIPNKIGSNISKNNVKRTKKIFGIGYPTLSPYVIYGQVYITFGHDHYTIMEVIPGCSGSGLYDENNLLVGIVWGDNGFGLGIYEPVTQIRKFLKEVGYE